MGLNGWVDKLAVEMKVGWLSLVVMIVGHWTINRLSIGQQRLNGKSVGH